MSPARIIKIARLVPFDELKRRNLSELLRLPSFLMLVKQWENPSANTLLPILQSKFGSAESEPFAHFQRMKPRITTTGNMNGSFLTWNLTIFFCPIPTKPATILTPISQDWWTNVTWKGPYLPMSFQSQGSDSVFATEHWQLQGASQYSALIFYKTYAHSGIWHLTYAHSGIWHLKNLQNTVCDKLPLKGTHFWILFVSLSLSNFGDELSRALLHPLNVVNGGKNVTNFLRKKQNTQNFKNQQLIDVGLNLSDYKFRQENKEKYEERLLF